jgi:Icc-related predicted phosphoesterase
MRVVVISDTHNFTNISLPEGDLLIHCGDALGWGEEEELEAFNTWLGKLKFKKIIYVAGNHDGIFELDKWLAKSILTNAHYLEDELVEYNGFKIYGTPWTSPFGNWWFALTQQRQELAFDLIPEGLDVLISHGPPLGVLDEAIKGKFLGSRALLNAVLEKKPRYHLFGHIHESYGSAKNEHTQFYNCAILNELYRPLNSPVVFDLIRKK